MQRMFIAEKNKPEQCDIKHQVDQAYDSVLHALEIIGGIVSVSRCTKDNKELRLYFVEEIKDSIEFIPLNLPAELFTNKKPPYALDDLANFIRAKGIAQTGAVSDLSQDEAAQLARDFLEFLNSEEASLQEEIEPLLLGTHDPLEKDLLTRACVVLEERFLELRQLVRHDYFVGCDLEESAAPRVASMR